MKHTEKVCANTASQGLEACRLRVGYKEWC